MHPLINGPWFCVIGQGSSGCRFVSVGGVLQVIIEEALWVNSRSQNYLSP